MTWTYREDNDTFEAVEKGMKIVIENAHRFPLIIAASKGRLGLDDKRCEAPGPKGMKCTRPLGHGGKHLQCTGEMEIDQHRWW